MWHGADLTRSLTQEQKDHAAELAQQDSLPWRGLNDICTFLREQSGEAGQDGPWLHQLCRGSELSLPAPPARVPSPAVQARLAKLRADLEAKNYAAMVHDVTGTLNLLTQERAAEALREGGLRSYKDQLAFGAHVLVMMGTFYALGHVAGGALRPLPAYRAAGGLIGLTVALLLETLLLVIRTNVVPELPIEARLQRKVRRRDLAQDGVPSQQQNCVRRGDQSKPNSSEQTSEDSKKTR